MGFAYDKIEVEIKDKTTGKVRVVRAYFRLRPKPAEPVVVYENIAKMPILVRTILYRLPLNSTGEYIKTNEGNFMEGQN